MRAWEVGDKKYPGIFEPQWVNPTLSPAPFSRCCIPDAVFQTDQELVLPEFCEIAPHRLEAGTEENVSKPRLGCGVEAELGTRWEGQLGNAIWTVSVARSVADFQSPAELWEK